MPPRTPSTAPHEDHPDRTTATGYRSVPYSVLADAHDRLKAAWWATRSQADGAPTLAALVERILTGFCERTEQLHNGGVEFPPAPAKAQGSRSASGTGRRARSYYLPSTLHERFKATWWATRNLPDGKPALNELIEGLFADEAFRLEEAHNEGRRFPAAPTRARGVSAEGARRQGDLQRQLWQSRRDEGRS